MANIKKSDIYVLIPTYNEEARIAEVVSRAKELGFNVIVSDDASKDRTAEQVNKIDGATVLTASINQGKGAALRRGFEFLSTKGYEAVILMDGDGQHDPAELELFFKALGESKESVIVGNRMPSSKNMPLIRRATNLFLSWILSVASGQNIPDSQCGYRAFRREVLEKIVLKTNRFEIESEMLLEASRLGFKIGWVPVRTVYAGEKSQINPLVDTGRFIKFMLKYKLVKR